MKIAILTPLYKKADYQKEILAYASCLVFAGLSWSASLAKLVFTDIGLPAWPAKEADKPL